MGLKITIIFTCIEVAIYLSIFFLQALAVKGVPIDKASLIVVTQLLGRTISLQLPLQVILLAIYFSLGYRAGLMVICLMLATYCFVGVMLFTDITDLWKLLYPFDLYRPREGFVLMVSSVLSFLICFRVLDLDNKSS